MADSYEKRARERRKQQKRRAKLEEKRTRDPDAPKDDPAEHEWFEGRGASDPAAEEA